MKYQLGGRILDGPVLLNCKLTSQSTAVPRNVNMKNETKHNKDIQGDKKLDKLQFSTYVIYNSDKILHRYLLYSHGVHLV